MDPRDHSYAVAVTKLEVEVVGCARYISAVRFLLIRIVSRKKFDGYWSNHKNLESLPPQTACNAQYSVYIMVLLVVL